MISVHKQRQIKQSHAASLVKLVLIATLLPINQPSVFANDGKIVYYCISDKMVGIQENEEKSGFIKPVKPNFTLAYFPAEILRDGDDPFYKSPLIIASPFSGDGTTYYLKEALTPFEDSSQRLSETTWFELFAKNKNAKKLFNDVIEKTKNGPFGAYGFSNFLGSSMIQLWQIETNKLSGMASSVEIVGKDNVKKLDYKFYGYLLHFTCSRF